MNLGNMRWSSHREAQPGFVDVLRSYFKNLQFMLTLLIAVLCLIIVILWGGYGYPPGMRDFSGYVLFSHAAPAFTVVCWVLVIAYLLNEEPPPKLQLLFATSGVILFFVVVILQAINLDDYAGPRIFIHFGFHIAVLIVLIVHLVLLFLGYTKHTEEEERPYVVRMSRGGLPVYR